MKKPIRAVDPGVTALGMIRNFGADAENMAREIADRWGRKKDPDAQTFWDAIGDLIAKEPTREMQLARVMRRENETRRAGNPMAEPA